MNLTTFTDIFSGSPYKPLLRHRKAVLEALGLLNRQLQSSLSAKSIWKGRPEWLSELTLVLERHEKELITCLHQPMITAPPKELILSMMQTQTNMAHTINRLAERLSYRPVKLLPDMQDQMIQLYRHFGKAVFLLRQGIAELEGLNKAGFRKQHASTLKQAHQELVYHIEALRECSSNLREMLFQHENQLEQMDIALLLLTLDDIEDLTLWMRSMIIQIQP
ncbi:hypothetical protein ACH42_16195 [Endozoicomonas sp. (ex Bugula neritina AB1)]|nr:hypothetical protein ACH42_16195 [Endozoicomonas sp. (ex Bugula neritina AB1)]